MAGVDKFNEARFPYFKITMIIMYLFQEHGQV